MPYPRLEQLQGPRELGVVGDRAGFGRNQAEMLRDFVVDPSLPSLQKLPGFQHQNRSQQRVDLCISPPSKTGKHETFEITLLDLFEVKIFSLRVNVNFHLDV